MTREEAINEIKSWAIPSKNGRKVLETLIPELRESEDERVRKTLSVLVQNAIYPGLITEEDSKKCLAYLEKQKETSHISETCKENANSFADGIIEVRSFQRGMEEGRRLERQKEQKPAKLTSLATQLSDYLKNDFEYFATKKWDEKKWNEVMNIQASELLRIAQNELKKEQKSVECIEFNNEFEKQVSHLLASVLNGEWEYNEGFVKHAAQSLLGYAKHELELDGKALLYTADKSYQIGFRDGVASVKPAELEQLAKLREMTHEIRDAYERGIEVGRVESKQEWSEEDEKTINDACCWIAEYAGYLMDKNYGKASMLMGLTDKLKSLRPQSQGIYQQVVKGIRDMCDRYEQNGMFTDERARDFLGNVRVKCKDAIECAPILDEPSWKPSEEQMKALLNAEGFLRAGLQHDSAKIIAELYEQLKKL